MHSRGRTSFFLSLLTRPSPARFRKLEQISFVSIRVIRRITFHSTLLFTSKSLGQKPSVLNTSGRGLPSPNQFDSLKRCLDRDVKTRLRDIGEARVAITSHTAQRPLSRRREIHHFEIEVNLL